MFESLVSRFHIWLVRLTIMFTLFASCLVIAVIAFWLGESTEVLAFAKSNKDFQIVHGTRHTILIERSYTIRKPTDCTVKRYIKKLDYIEGDVGLYYFFHDISLPQSASSISFPVNSKVYHAIDVPILPVGHYNYISTLYCNINPLVKSIIPVPPVSITIQ